MFVGLHPVRSQPHTNLRAGSSDLLPPPSSLAASVRSPHIDTSRQMGKPRAKVFLPLSRRFQQYFQQPRERRQRWRNAVLDGNLQRMVQCLAEGQPIDECGDWGRSALYLASERGRADVMLFLCAAGANVEVVEKGDYCRPLHTAVYHGHVAAAEILLKYGAQVNETNWYGRTPLDLVAVCVREHKKAALRELLTAAGGRCGTDGAPVPVARGIPVATAELAPDEEAAVTATLLAPEDAAVEMGKGSSGTVPVAAVTARLLPMPAPVPDDAAVERGDEPSATVPVVAAPSYHADADDSSPAPAPEAVMTTTAQPASIADLTPDVKAPPATAPSSVDFWAGVPPRLSMAEPAGPGTMLATSPPGARPGSRLLVHTFAGCLYEVRVPTTTCLNQFAVRLPSVGPDAGGDRSCDTPEGMHTRRHRVLVSPRPGWAIGMPLATADGLVREVVVADNPGSGNDLGRIRDIAAWLCRVHGLRPRAARALAVVCVQRGHDSVQELAAAPEALLRELNIHGELSERLTSVASGAQSTGPWGA